MSSSASYKGSRLSLPRLINGYCAIQESHEWQDPVNGPTIRVPQSAAGNSMNELFRFEPTFTPQNFLSGSPLATSLFDRYDQFRVRKVAARLTESSVNPSNVARSDCWIYWCSNHTTYDADVAAGTSYNSVTDLAEASRIQHVSSQPGRAISIEVVPQVVFQNSVQIGAVPTIQNGDGKFPWMDTTALNASTLCRMPIMFFRRPLDIGSNVPVHFPVYQCVLVCVLEFRNMSDDN